MNFHFHLRFETEKNSPCFYVFPEIWIFDGAALPFLVVLVTTRDELSARCRLYEKFLLNWILWLFGEISIIWPFCAQYLRIKCARKLRRCSASALGFKSLLSWSFLHPLTLAFNPHLIHDRRCGKRSRDFPLWYSKCKNRVNDGFFLRFRFPLRYRINNPKEVKSHVLEHFFQ